MVSESPSLLQLLSWIRQRSVIHREELQWCARGCACRASLFVTPPSIYCTVLQSCPVTYKADTACPPNPTVGGVEARSSESLLVQTVGRKKQPLLEVFGLAVVGAVSCYNETASCQTCMQWLPRQAPSSGPLGSSTGSQFILHVLLSFTPVCLPSFLTLC